ncbi:phosphotransferase-like protein [Devosia sp.]|uniref:chloramphenicol phosphotransferase CPT family protein n=1 Tax=Devosia sp. TaxID=1871048 RepID=UPI003262F3DC
MTERQTAQAGKIIFLHGASSSGKSTLARALQSTIGQPFWHVSIDHLRDAGVLPSARIKSGEFAWSGMRKAFFGGFHGSLAAYAASGNNLIVEHILDTPGWHGDLAALLKPFEVFFVAVHCPLGELIRREQQRGDRGIGSAEKDFHAIHQGVNYDLELQTASGVDANVQRIIAGWAARKGGSNFFVLPAPI